MQLLSSDWLKRMVSKSSPSAEARIVNLFAILQDWLDAPGMNEQLLPATLDADSHRELKAYLLALVRDANIGEPDKLATQLCFIILGAIHDVARNPGSQAMARAGEAAACLLAAARPPRFNNARRLVAVASMSMVVIVASALMMPFESGQPAPARHIAAQPSGAMPPSARPDRLAALYQMNEKLRGGQCSYPQALMLAAEHRAAFLEGVVNIDTLNTTTTNLDEVGQLYQHVQCTYAPAAMLL